MGVLKQKDESWIDDARSSPNTERTKQTKGLTQTNLQS